MNIYILICSVGEYSDREEYPILCAKNKEFAENKVLEFTNIVNENYSILKDIENNNYYNYELIELKKEEMIKKNPLIYKNEYISDYNTPSFFIKECELID